jgi:hypothetical protein
LCRLLCLGAVRLSGSPCMCPRARRCTACGARVWRVEQRTPRCLRVWCAKGKLVHQQWCVEASARGRLVFALGTAIRPGATQGLGVGLRTARPRVWRRSWCSSARVCWGGCCWLAHNSGGGAAARHSLTKRQVLLTGCAEWVRAAVASAVSTPCACVCVCAGCCSTVHASGSASGACFRGWGTVSMVSGRRRGRGVCLCVMPCLSLIRRARWMQHT